MPKSPLTGRDRLAVMVRIAPDATNFRTSNILNIEVIASRAVFNGKRRRVFHEAIPRCEPHRGGWGQVLQDIYVVLKGLCFPMPGSTTMHYADDPLILFSLCTDAGSDELKALKVFKKMCRAINATRRTQLELLGKMRTGQNVGPASSSSSSSSAAATSSSSSNVPKAAASASNTKSDNVHKPRKTANPHSTWNQRTNLNRYFFF